MTFKKIKISSNSTETGQKARLKIATLKQTTEVHHEFDGGGLCGPDAGGGSAAELRCDKCRSIVHTV